MIATSQPPTMTFDQKEVIALLKQYLPHQFPLKGFVNHNVLECFQHLPFHEAMHAATEIFGYKTYLLHNEYLELYHQGKISDAVLNRIIVENEGIDALEGYRRKLLVEHPSPGLESRIGQLRDVWVEKYHFNMGKKVQGMLFRLISNFLDQGVGMKKFPLPHRTLLSAIRELEFRSFGVHIFQSKRVRKILKSTKCKIPYLLDLLIGNEKYYMQYLFDQQFSHPGWSGMVAMLEQHPDALLDKRQVTLEEFIILELLLELDALDKKFGEGNWEPLSKKIHKKKITPIFDIIPDSDGYEISKLWQEAYEWSFYDQVLKGLQLTPDVKSSHNPHPSFQAMFCIDDRECSLRRYIEKFDKNCKTYGTAGFFQIDCYYQPEHGKFYEKSCPAPVTPNYLIKEVGCKTHHHRKEAHFSKESGNIVGGWLISQTMGFWSAIQLAWNIFFPSDTPVLVSSFKHMDRTSKLVYEYDEELSKKQGIHVGYTVEEMTNRMESLLKSIGLTENFADIIYFIGHGASSVNNPHYAAYGCGACNGQTGSVNARVAASMANKPIIREYLRKRGIDIPDTTQFVGGLHDTTQDEMDFYDEEFLSPANKVLHEANKKVFVKSLHHNAKERSRRFFLMDSDQSAAKVHKEVKLRSMSLFEPRSEWDHASNALCLVGRRDTNKHLFLDRRSFLNSYDYEKDLDGKYLLGILKAVAPVCGGINLQYYFAKTDSHRLGAGSKLPHNVISLIGVANGIDGDLRIGLPRQSVDIHDSLRLMAVVEHFPEVVLKTIQSDENTYQWFQNAWVHLVVIDPTTLKLYKFQNDCFVPYETTVRTIPSTSSIEELLIKEEGNLPIYVLK